MNKAVKLLAQLRLLKSAIAENEQMVEEEVKRFATDTMADRFRTEYGTVSVTHPKKHWKVTDHGAFTRWVEKNHASAMIHEVSPAFKKMVLEDGGICDYDTGEIVVPDGMEEVEGPQVVTVRLDRDVKESAAGTLLDQIGDALPKELRRE